MYADVTLYYYLLTIKIIFVCGDSKIVERKVCVYKLLLLYYEL